MTLCYFLGAKLMHFVSKTSAFVSFCYKRFCVVIFLLALTVFLLLNCKQNNY